MDNLTPLDNRNVAETNLFKKKGVTSRLGEFLYNLKYKLTGKEKIINQVADETLNNLDLSERDKSYFKKDIKKVTYKIMKNKSKSGDVKNITTDDVFVNTPKKIQVILKEFRKYGPIKLKENADFTNNLKTFRSQIQEQGDEEEIQKKALNDRELQNKAIIRSKQLDQCQFEKDVLNLLKDMGEDLIEYGKGKEGGEFFQPIAPVYVSLLNNSKFQDAVRIAVPLFERGGLLSKDNDSQMIYLGKVLLFEQAIDMIEEMASKKNEKINEENKNKL